MKTMTACVKKLVVKWDNGWMVRTAAAKNWQPLPGSFAMGAGSFALEKAAFAWARESGIVLAPYVNICIEDPA
jgi:hypothetical protein